MPPPYRGAGPRRRRIRRHADRAPGRRPRSVSRPVRAAAVPARRDRTTTSHGRPDCRRARTSAGTTGSVVRTSPTSPHGRKPPIARVGYDLTLTVEKSFGIVMMLAPEHIGRRFVDALDVANTTALDHLDRHAAVARRRGDVVGSEGLVGASYFHATSRALDPHPHRHNVIANAVVDDEGGIRALDARALYREGPTAAALATAAARWELRDLGLGWWRRDDGIWEIAGVDDAAIDEFSSRDREISEITSALERELGRPVTLAERRKIWADTRADKTAVDPTALQASWRDRADRVGLDVTQCLRSARSGDRLRPSRHPIGSAPVRRSGRPRHRTVRIRGPVHPRRRDRGDRRLVARTTSTATDARCCSPSPRSRHSPTGSCPATSSCRSTPALGRGVLRRSDGQLVDDGHPDRRYSTREILTVQQQVLDAWRRRPRRRRRRRRPERSSPTSSPSIRHLSDEQVALVRSWCTSGHRVQAAIGRAGTGKTTTMRAAAAAWRAAGYRVIGAAVKGEAARKLAPTPGSTPTPSRCCSPRRAATRTSSTPAPIVIVDEASTLGDRDLAALLRLAAETGATLRTIGDPAQHQSVPTGGCWSYLVTHSPDRRA